MLKDFSLSLVCRIWVIEAFLCVSIFALKDFRDMKDWVPSD